MDSTAEATAFPVFGPSRGTPARPRGGASPEGGRVGSRCMQRHCRWRRCCRLRCYRFRDSVAVSCIAACCASLPAEHCRPAAERIIAAALHSCFATMQPALCRLRRPSLTACSRFDSSASWVSQIVSVPESQQCQWPRYRRCYASNCQVPESLLRAIASSSTTSATKYLQQTTLTACTRFDPSAS